MSKEKAACGKFIYLRHTKPECAYAISQVCRFASMPTTAAWKQAKRIAQYAFNTRHKGVMFRKCTSEADLFRIRAFADSSFLDCLDTGRSTGGYCIFWNGCLLSFESKRLPLVTLSTAESEYVEAARCAAEVTYIKELLNDFDITVGCVPIMEDNEACVQISKNPVHHQRTKHVAKFYHFVRDQCLSGDIELAGIGTDYQVADIFTKPLAHAKFRAFREVLCGYRSYEQLLNSNEEKQAEIRQLQAYDFQLQNQISLAGHPLACFC